MVVVGVERGRGDHVPLLPEVRHVVATVDGRVQNRLYVVGELISVNLNETDAGLFIDWLID